MEIKNSLEKITIGSTATIKVYDCADASNKCVYTRTKRYENFEPTTQDVTEFVQGFDSSLTFDDFVCQHWVTGEYQTCKRYDTGETLRIVLIVQSVKTVTTEIVWQPSAH